MKRLPIGIQTFSEIIEKNYLYIDKTKYIYELIDSGKVYFYSRPRRFGKSLLVSAMKSVFQGKKELFKGLYIYDKIPWVEHPVIHIDFSGITYSETTEIFTESLKNKLCEQAALYGITINKEMQLKELFQTVIQNLSGINSVAILIDEYDKPIIDHITSPEKAKENREVLRDFFSVLKGADPYISFLFLTGVSKFSRVSIFSGLNNLRDITISDQFASMLGYTQAELEYYFENRIKDFAEKENMERGKLLEEIKRWYNGYSWDGKNKVYNPFSVLNLFAEGRFRNYWFDSGTPSFLIDLLRKDKIEIPEVENKIVTDLVLNSYDIENLNYYSLLLQTGYSTIKSIGTEEGYTVYRLEYPNIEVKQSLHNFVTF